jgi:hypothetical protein
MGIVGMKKVVLKDTLCFSSHVGNGTLKKKNRYFLHLLFSSQDGNCDTKSFSDSYGE